MTVRHGLKVTSMLPLIVTHSFENIPYDDSVYTKEFANLSSHCFI
jgi:hypothetical protein